MINPIGYLYKRIEIIKLWIHVLGRPRACSDHLHNPKYLVEEVEDIAL